MNHSIVVLFGGNGSERKVSVATAQHLAQVVEAPQAWFWAADGRVHEVSVKTLAAHERAFERDFDPKAPARWPSLEAALDDASQNDTFIIGLHGGAGEDGTVQRWLEQRQLAFTGSGSEGSQKAFDKARAKSIARRAGIRVAESIIVSGKDSAVAEAALSDMLERHRRLVMKPVSDGSSSGLVFLEGVGHLGRAQAALAAAPTTPFLAEVFVAGTELTVGVLETEHGLRALPCSEVRVERGRSFDYAGKYLGHGTREITPAEVPAEVHSAAGKVALAVHEALGLRGYSRTDLIVDGQGPVFLEINNLPGLTRASFIPQQLAAADITMAQFLARQLDIARAARPTTR